MARRQRALSLMTQNDTESDIKNVTENQGEYEEMTSKNVANQSSRTPLLRLSLFLAL